MEEPVTTGLRRLTVEFKKSAGSDAGSGRRRCGGLPNRGKGGNLGSEDVALVLGVAGAAPPSGLPWEPKNPSECCHPIPVAILSLYGGLSLPLSAKQKAGWGRC